jgi:hypothetical protein
MSARRALASVFTVLLASTGACGRLKPANADVDGAAGSSAAGTSGAAGAGGSLLLTVSGTAAPHPLNKLLLGEDEPFSMLQVSIVDPSAVIIDPNAPPLGSMTLDTTTAGNCDPTLGCMWSITGVDLSNPNLLGLVGEIQDLRTGDGGSARVWVTTGTGMGSMADLAAVRAAPAPITGRRAFAVSYKLEAKLGAFLGPALNTTFNPGDLAARGFLIGHVTGTLPTDGSMPAPVAGATVTTPTTSGFDVVYPNADFSGKGTSTSSSGIFLMVPRTAGAVVTSWQVVPPMGDTRTWPPYLAGSNPNNAFIIILFAT